MEILYFKNELFTELKNYKNYYVSKNGYIISIFKKGGRGLIDKNNPHFLKPSKDKDGYLNVILKINGCRVSKRVHRLIAETYLYNYSENLLVNHIDGNKQNNNIDNLEMVNNSENLLHAHNTNLIITTHNAIKIIIFNKQEKFTFNSIEECRKKFPILSREYINEVRLNKITPYVRYCFIVEDNKINCYVNGELLNSFNTNKEIANKYNKKNNTISVKKNNVKDLKYKDFKIMFE